MSERVRTDYWAKPIPDRRFDWSAWYDNDEPNDNGSMLVGYGATEREAVADLYASDADRAPDLRIMCCPECGGDGGWEYFTGGYDPRNGSADTAWATCGACDGKSEIEVEVTPITADDLDCEQSDYLRHDHGFAP